MAFIKCSGSKLRETVLWENPSPTSAFTTQTVLLNQSINNFKYLKFYYRISKSNSTENFIIISVDNFTLMTYENNSFFGGLTGKISNDNSYCRVIVYKSSTSISIQTATKLKYAAATGDYFIPTKINGMKY